MAQSPQKHWYQSWMIKVASIVLGFGILFFALPGAAQADDISEVLSWWSDSAFQLFKPSEKIETQSHSYKTEHTGLQQVYDAVTELGIIDPIVPTWVPKGFELTELNSYPALGSTMIFALFSREEFEILITFPQII